MNPENPISPDAAAPPPEPPPATGGPVAPPPLPPLPMDGGMPPDPYSLPAAAGAAPFRSPEEIGPWGAWATLGLGVAIVIGWVIAQSVGGIIAVIAGGLETANPHNLEEELMSSGWLAGITIAALPVLLLLVWGAIALRRGPSLPSYLGLNFRRLWVIPVGIIALYAYSFAAEGFLQLVGDTSGQEFAMETLKANNPALMFLLVAFAAPIGEEVLFRGFMYRGLASSPAGVWGAILLPNLVWVPLHAQYSAWTLLVLFGLGVLFGIARAVSGSLTVPLALHFANNAWVFVVAHLFPEELESAGDAATAAVRAFL